MRAGTILGILAPVMGSSINTCLCSEMVARKLSETFPAMSYLPYTIPLQKSGRYKNRSKPPPPDLSPSALKRSEKYRVKYWYPNVNELERLMKKNPGNVVEPYDDNNLLIGMTIYIKNIYVTKDSQEDIEAYYSGPDAMMENLEVLHPKFKLRFAKSKEPFLGENVLFVTNGVYREHNQASGGVYLVVVQ